MEQVVRHPLVQEFVVSLSIPEKAASGRTKVVAENLRLGEAFAKRLRKLIKSRGLEVEVAYVGEPMTLPFVTIEATDRVANLVRQMPEVDSVVQEHGIFESFA